MKRRLATTVLVLLLTGWGLTLSEVSATTLTSGNATMEIDATTQDGISSWVVDGVDHLFQQWFWFRTSSTSAEASLDTLGPPVEVSGASDATFTFTGSGLEVFLSYSLFGGAAGSGLSSLGEFVSITNTGTSPITLSWFEYTDFDLSETSDDDTGTSPGPGSFTQTDAFTTATISAGPPPTFFEIDFFEDLRDKLNDASPTTLADATSPLGPGDITQAFQWDVTLGAGESFGYEKSKSIESTAQVPMPPALILLGAALAVTAIASRNRRRS